jgi:hypothetical protein
MNPSIKVWKQIVCEQSPITDEHAADFLYYRAVTAYWENRKLEISDGMGGQIDLTTLFEQCRMLALLTGESNENNR